VYRCGNSTRFMNWSVRVRNISLLIVIRDFPRTPVTPIKPTIWIDVTRNITVTYYYWTLINLTTESSFQHSVLYLYKYWTKLPIFFKILQLAILISLFQLVITVGLHLSVLIGTASQTDMQEIRIIGFFFENRLHWQFQVRSLLFTVCTRV